MRVFERVGRMLRADAHGMMDQLEERSLLLRQHLREAEAEVAQKRTRLEAIDVERSCVKDQGQRLEEEVSSLDQDVTLAMAGEDPDLARFAIKRWLPKRAALTELFAKAARLEHRRTRLLERLELQERQLAELRAQVRAALVRPETETALRRVCDPATTVTEEEVDLELLRRRGMAEADAVVGEAER